MNDIEAQGYRAYYEEGYANCPYSADNERDFYDRWNTGWLIACDEDTDYGKS